MDVKIFHSAEFVFFTTRDYALSSSISLPAAAKRLSRLAQNGAILKITRGIWANPSHPHFQALGAVPHILGAEQGYVSFLTALHHHGVISQIPPTVQIATTGHGRRLKTAIGSFELFQLKPAMMRDGIVWSQSKCPYRIASPEKALLDTLYLATRKGRRFASLPEVDVSGLNKKTFTSLLTHQVTSLRLKNAVRQAAGDLGLL